MKKMNGQMMVPYHIWNNDHRKTHCPHQDMLGSGQELCEKLRKESKAVGAPELVKVPAE